MIITISGHAGSGKSTAGKLLAKKLHYRYFSIGAIRREMAKKRGLTLAEYNKLGERQAFTDKPVDDWQRRTGKLKDRIVMEGRLSWFFIPRSIKIFLSVDPATGARRVWDDASHHRRQEGLGYSLPDFRHSLQQRVLSDRKRYRYYYGVNIFHKQHYDLYLDTTKLTPNQTVKKILDFLANLVRGNSNQATGRSKPRGTQKEASSRAKISPAPLFPPKKVVLGKAKEAGVHRQGKTTKSSTDRRKKVRKTSGKKNG